MLKRKRAKGHTRIKDDTSYHSTRGGKKEKGCECSAMSNGNSNWEGSRSGKQIEDMDMNHDCILESYLSKRCAQQFQYTAGNKISEEDSNGGWGKVESSRKIPAQMNRRHTHTGSSLVHCGESDHGLDDGKYDDAKIGATTRQSSTTYSGSTTERGVRGHEENGHAVRNANSADMCKSTSDWNRDHAGRHQWGLQERLVPHMCGKRPQQRVQQRRERHPAHRHAEILDGYEGAHELQGLGYTREDRQIVCLYSNTDGAGHRRAEQDGGGPNVKRRGPAVYALRGQHKGVPPKDGLCKRTQAIQLCIHHVQGHGNKYLCHGIGSMHHRCSSDLDKPDNEGRDGEVHTGARVPLPDKKLRGAERNHGAGR
eukprot:9282202-Heterocapsa_arctica.AAC.1